MTPALVDSSITQWAAALGWPSEGLLRLGLAALCGGLVGIEREIRGRQAGFRTNLLVCVGSAIVMIVSIQLAVHPWHTDGDPHVNINTDPGRIAYSVMTGIGFLGAGTIIHNKRSIHGLTTAAALWCTAALGLSAGIGLYLFTLLASVVVVSALWLLSYVERFIPKTRYRTVTVATPWSPGCIATIVNYFKLHEFGVIETSFDRTNNPAVAHVTIDVSYRSDAQFARLEDAEDVQRHFQILSTRESQK